MTAQAIKEEVANRLATGQINQDQARAILQRYAETQGIQPQQTMPVSFQPEQQTMLGAAGQAISQDIEAGKKAAKAFGDVVLGLDRRTEETQTLPELYKAPVTELGPSISYMVRTGRDAEEIANAVRKKFGDDAVRTDEKGNYVAYIDGYEYIINRPGLSGQDIEQAKYEALMFAPASRIAAAGRGVLSRLALGGGASGLTQAGIEAGQVAAGGEFDVGEIGVATAFGTLGELPAALMQTKRMSPEARALLPEIDDETEELVRRLQSQFGINLTPDQATGLDSDRLLAFMLRNSPDLSDEFSARFKEQETAVLKATKDFIADLAATDARALAATNVKQVAGESLETIRRARADATKTLYDKVWETASANSQIIDVEPIIRMIETRAADDTLSTQRQAANLILEIRNAATPSLDGASAGSNVLKLHNAKRSIFEDLDQLAGKDGVATKQFRDIAGEAWAATRKALIDQADGYAEATARYLELSPAVDLLKNSKIGVIESIPDAKLSKVSSEIFNPSEFKTNRQQFELVKKTIQEANPDAWNALVANRIEGQLLTLGDEIDQLASQAPDVRINNIEKAYRRVFSGENRAITLNALDGEARKNYLELSEAVSRSRSRPAGSATASNQEIQSRLKGDRGVATFVRTIIGASPEQLLSTAIGGGSRDVNMRILSEIYTSPNWVDRLSEIRKMGMETPRGGAAFAQLFKDVLASETEDDQDN